MKPRSSRRMSPGTVLLIRQIIVGALIATFFGLLFSTVWFTTRIGALTISEITIRGGETIQHEEVERILRTKIDGAYMRLVPRAFAFTYPHDEIVSELSTIHRIKDVQVTRSGGNGLVVEFDEYVPHALWCKSNDDMGCFFLDEKGYSFAPAPPLAGGAFLRFVAIGKDTKEHEQAFKEEEYIKTHELVSKLVESKWFVSKIEIDAAGDAFMTIVDGGQFKVSLKQSADETVANLRTVLGSEKFAHIKPGNFEYIDLRFGEKVFVNEVTITDSTIASSSDEIVTNEEVSEPAPAEEIPVAAEEVPVEEAVATTTAE